MNIWLFFAALFLVSLVPSGFVLVSGSTMQRLVALQFSQLLLTLVLLLLATGYGRSTYFDVALALAVLSFAGSLTFVRFLERWL